ncbi:MAG: glycoside hydrolase family 3 N-terminal domain-containing protein [bacterium]
MWGRGAALHRHRSGGRPRAPAARSLTVFAEMAQLGQVDSVSVAYEVGAVIGRELTATGFNLNFAPVLDVNTNPDNPIIGRRAISEDPELVASTAKALVRGLHDNAIIACGKHFPGHGHTSEDSHLTLPVCDLDMERMRQVELKPYQRLMQGSPARHGDDGPRPLPEDRSAVPGHPEPDHPTGPPAARMGFKGLVITDDLEMKAITETVGIAEATRRPWRPASTSSCAAPTSISRCWCSRRC